ncbi:MAG: ABC transporter ATP-binding protein [Firmicutes bacterium]|nr:ABC transporter ATP-binding protein [Bacillota bacterium]
MSFHYPGRSLVESLDHVSVTFPPGRTALVGPNGAGKTSLIKLLAGINRPTSGRIRLAGLGAPSEPRVRRSIAAVLDRDGLYGRLTGWENLDFLTVFRGGDRRVARARAEPWLAQWELTPAMPRRVDTWSRGMRQKLALLLAFISDAQVLLLDEAWEGLSADARETVLEAFGRRDDQDLVTVFATHDLSEVERWADRVVVLRAGRVVWDGPISSLPRARLRVTLDPAAPVPAGLPFPARRHDGELWIEIPPAVETSAAIEALVRAGLKFRSVVEESGLADVAGVGATPGHGEATAEEPGPPGPTPDNPRETPDRR